MKDHVGKSNMTMTRRIMHDLHCACGRHFRRWLYHALDVAEQPGLRYAVLGGVLNTVQCPSCECIARVDVPLLYRDASRGHLVYVYPAGSEESAGEIRGQIVKMVQDLRDSEPEADVMTPSLMFGLEQLGAAIGDELDDDEKPGSVSFDVRPGTASERGARVLSGRVALHIGGCVYSWREGGRLHVRIIGPRKRLESVTLDDGKPMGY